LSHGKVDSSIFYDLVCCWIWLVVLIHIVLLHKWCSFIITDILKSYSNSRGQSEAVRYVSKQPIKFSSRLNHRKLKNLPHYHDFLYAVCLVKKQQICQPLHHQCGSHLKNAYYTSMHTKHCQLWYITEVDWLKWCSFIITDILKSYSNSRGQSEAVRYVSKQPIKFSNRLNHRKLKNLPFHVTIYILARINYISMMMMMMMIFILYWTISQYYLTLSITVQCICFIWMLI
jgi:hypothetical protein